MTNKTQKAKSNNKQASSKRALETVGEIGSHVVNSVKNEARGISEEFFRQLLGQQKNKEDKKSIGSIELPFGQSVKISETQLHGAENKKLQEQMYFERRLFIEENQEAKRRINDLRIRLRAIQTEANSAIAATVGLSQEIKTAVMQNVTTVSEYQINYLESIIKIISDFRKKIDQTIVWMQGQNERAKKKNYWAQYKKKGASFLLSGESYLQRSAG